MGGPRVRVGASERPKTNQRNRDATHQSDPAALRQQKRGDRGDTEGSERSVRGIACGDAEAGGETAPPAAREGTSKDQEENRSGRQSNREPNEESEDQRPDHHRLECAAL